MDDFDSVRVLSKPETLKLLGLSGETWYRMQRAGQLPPATQISDRRIGYRLLDLKAWLDQRRRGAVATELTE